MAGDRGRRGNYLYGSAKSGLSTYAEGLRSRLFPHRVTVTTIKPGPVDTGMTFGMDKLPLLAPPKRVASDIYRGAAARRRCGLHTRALAPDHGRAENYPGFLWKRLNF